MQRLIILTVAVALALSACATDGERSEALTSESLPGANDPSVSSGAETGGELIPVEPNEGIGDAADGSDLPDISPILSAEVELAIADLTDRLGDDVLIGVLVAHELTWPNGSLGCPEPDTSYTQALVDGYRIELSDGSDTYDYHGSRGERPFLCENVIEAAEEEGGPGVKDQPEPETPAVEEPIGVVEAGLSGLVDQAVADLSSRLGLDLEFISIVSAASVVWPDGALGCPQPDMRYTQVQVDGTLIVLEANRSTWNYHSGGGRGPFLCEPTK